LFIEKIESRIIQKDFSLIIIHKRKILVYLCLFALLSIIISFGLSDLILSPGMPLPDLNISRSDITKTQIEEMEIEQKNIVPKSIFIIIFTIAGVIAIYIIIKKRNFRGLKSIFISIVTIFLIIAFIVGLFVLLIPDKAPEMIKETSPLFREKQPTTSSVNVPEIMLWILGIVIAGFSGVLVFRLLSLKNKNRTRDDAIENESLKARKAIELGENLNEVVIRYYQNLCMILKKEQAIEREIFSTANEFGKKLAATGAPENSIRDLTHLFETARYGNLEILPGSDETALRSFDDIISYFRTKREREEHEKK